MTRFAMLALVASLGSGCNGAEAPPGEPFIPEPLNAGEVATILSLSPLPKPPPDPTNRWSDDPRAAHLGQRLFFDQRLSKGGVTSCATCHDPRDSFVDGDPLATGVLPLERHTMGIWNVAYNRWFFWDGRADSLWAQALIPFESPLEHATTRLEIAHVLHGDPVLRPLYEEVFGALPDLGDEERFPPYGRPVPVDDHAHVLAEEHARTARERAATGDGPGHHTHIGGSGFVHPHQKNWDSVHPDDQQDVTRVFVNVGKAIAAYERRLISRRAPFDVFVEGLREHDEEKLAMLDDSERRGLQVFLGKGQCIVCHHGPNFTDMEFHASRLPAAEGAPPDDPGRLRGLEVVRTSEFNVAGPWSDDPDGPARVKIDYLPTHVHGGGEFKTPSLRNVALTPPYMHHGGFATLEDVVRFYSDREGEPENAPVTEKILVPFDLTSEEQVDLVAFLHTLTDDAIDSDLLRAPE